MVIPRGDAPALLGLLLRLLLVENHAVFARIVVRQFLASHEVIVAATLREARHHLSTGYMESKGWSVSFPPTAYPLSSLIALW